MTDFQMNSSSKQLILFLKKIVLFDNVLHKQIKGTAMGTKFAPSYACLTIGFLEETKLFPIILPKYFNHETCEYIEVIITVKWMTVISYCQKTLILICYKRH